MTERNPPALPDLLNKDLEGYRIKLLPSLTVPNSKSVIIQPWMSKGTQLAAEFVAHRPGEEKTPYIFGDDRIFDPKTREQKTLRDLLKHSMNDYIRRVPKDAAEEQLDRIYNGSVREALCLVTYLDGAEWATSIGGIVGRDIPKDPSQFPRWSKILIDEDYHRIVEMDAHSFLTALGFEPPLIEQ